MTQFIAYGFNFNGNKLGEKGVFKLAGFKPNGYKCLRKEKKLKNSPESAGRPENEAEGFWQNVIRDVLDPLGDTQQKQASALGVSQGVISKSRSIRQGPPKSSIEKLLLVLFSDLPERGRAERVRKAAEKLRGLSS